MCEYCEESKEIINGMWLNISIKDSELMACTSDDCYEVKINYCPMCGRDLREPKP